ncbi:MAG: YkgJ family cysteine cluster protein [Archaeoglobaceae archaeon]
MSVNNIDTSKSLTLDDKLQFSCHPGIKCFNKCCGDLSLFLTPYDIIRMKNNLGITSTEFLKDYTKCNMGENSGLPVVFLKMKDDESCPFVTDEGCSIYKDRPSSCRLYPLARMKSHNKEYYHIVKEDHCKGFEEDKEWTVREWLEDQEGDTFNEMNDLFMEVISGKLKNPDKQLTDKELKMFYMACYNIDKFREFVASTKFLDYFDVDENIVDGSDAEIMKLGFKYVRFALFKEKTLQLRGTEVTE